MQFVTNTDFVEQGFQAQRRIGFFTDADCRDTLGDTKPRGCLLNGVARRVTVAEPDGHVLEAGSRAGSPPSRDDEDGLVGRKNCGVQGVAAVHRLLARDDDQRIDICRLLFDRRFFGADDRAPGDLGCVIAGSCGPGNEGGPRRIRALLGCPLVARA
jgi:hypothetical protein